MCEDAACDALMRSGPPERVSPVLMEQLGDRLREKAKARGMTLDDYVFEMNHIPYKPIPEPKEPLHERMRSWLESFWLNLRLLKPGL